MVNERALKTRLQLFMTTFSINHNYMNTKKASENYFTNNCKMIWMYELQNETERNNKYTVVRSWRKEDSSFLHG